MTRRLDVHPVFLILPRDARSQLRARLTEERRRRPSLTTARLLRELVLRALKENA